MGRSWPGAGAQFLDFIATLPMPGPHHQRPLWSKQIEKPHARVQSLEPSINVRPKPCRAQGWESMSEPC